MAAPLMVMGRGGRRQVGGIGASRRWQHGACTGCRCRTRWGCSHQCRNWASSYSGSRSTSGIAYHLGTRPHSGCAIILAELGQSGIDVLKGLVDLLTLLGS